jgi:hypothetical protein
LILGPSWSSQEYFSEPTFLTPGEGGFVDSVPRCDSPCIRREAKKRFEALPREFRHLDEEGVAGFEKGGLTG